MIDKSIPAIHAIGIRPALQCGNERLDKFGFIHIVRIQRADEFPSRGSDAGIARGGKPLVLLKDRANLIAERADHLAAVIARAIVDNDKFDVAVGLPQHAVNRLFDILGMVVMGNDDANKWKGFRHGSR